MKKEMIKLNRIKYAYSEEDVKRLASEGYTMADVESVVDGAGQTADPMKDQDGADEAGETADPMKDQDGADGAEQTADVADGSEQTADSEKQKGKRGTGKK